MSLSLTEPLAVLLIVGLIIVIGAMVLAVVVTAATRQQRLDGRLDHLIGRVERLEIRSPSRRRSLNDPSTRLVTDDARFRRNRERYEQD
jgi:hypothetical protein